MRLFGVGGVRIKLTEENRSTQRKVSPSAIFPKFWIRTRDLAEMLTNECMNLGTVIFFS